MLPGKAYKPEDVLQILRRRVWFLLVPFAVVSAGVAAWAYKLPDQFRSETVILVVPQRVPESYVRATVTTRIEDRLQSLTQQIMSRTRLERIIQDFNLYAGEAQDRDHGRHRRADAPRYQHPGGPRRRLPHQPTSATTRERSCG